MTLSRDELRERAGKYNPSSQIELPPGVVQRFKEQGFRLRWIRALAGNDIDYKNVGVWQREGYQFVTPQEVPELNSSTRIVDRDSFKNMVTLGDLALAKVPSELADAKAAYNLNQALELRDSVRRAPTGKGLELIDEKDSGGGKWSDTHFG